MVYLRRSPLVVSIFLLLFLCGVGAGAQSRRNAPSPLANAKALEPASVDAVSPGAGEATIPGPLRSFLRMAGISQKVSPDEVLPLLARNVVISGYAGDEGK